MREELDKVDPADLEGAFAAVLNAAQRNGVLGARVFYEGTYLCALDGTRMFSSNEIHCPNCCECCHGDGSTTYHHNLFAGAIVTPGVPTVLPLCPEPILKQDGESKNDCEIQASRRFLERIQRLHPRLKLTITADAIQATGPQVRLFEELGHGYLLKVKPGSHSHLFREVEDLLKLADEDKKREAARAIGESERRQRQDTRRAGQRKGPLQEQAPEPAQVSESSASVGELVYREAGEEYRVRWVNGVALNGAKDAPTVNYIECTRQVDEQDPKATARAQAAEQKKAERQQAWEANREKRGLPTIPTEGSKPDRRTTMSAVTDWKVTRNNAKKLIEGLRAEWKIENETFNTLKNQGYQFEHNYGHGYRNLQSVLALLMMLTFLTRASDQRDPQV